MPGRHKRPVRPGNRVVLQALHETGAMGLEPATSDVTGRRSPWSAEFRLPGARLRSKSRALFVALTDGVLLTADQRGSRADLTDDEDDQRGGRGTARITRSASSTLEDRPQKRSDVRRECRLGLTYNRPKANGASVEDT
jgi:hypothetical protein